MLARREAALGPEVSAPPEIAQKLLGALYGGLGKWRFFVHLQLRKFDDASAYDQQLAQAHIVLFI
jgi:hypothetical protein